MMIDLHAHILPGLDDGAENFGESVEMCLASYKDGVRTIVATPHTMNGSYRNNRSTILVKVRELNDLIKELKDPQPEISFCHQSKIEDSSGFRNREQRGLDLRILPGADFHFCEEVLSQLEQGNATTVGDVGKCLSLEFPFQGIPSKAEEVLFKLIARRVTPIISHPERNLEVRQRPQRYYEMIRMGCLGQVTAMSLTGGFGLEVRRVAEKLLASRLVHFIASDAHSIAGRPPILSEAVRAAERIVGRKEARKMVIEYPQAVLEGRKPNVPDPIAIR